MGDVGHVGCMQPQTGYKWIEKNTPADSRVLAWWDYGYQITGIAKRTSVADGNTWSHSSSSWSI